ncbi:reverse transcriptase domain-containing protein [Tanacetum coccineum]
MVFYRDDDVSWNDFGNSSISSKPDRTHICTITRSWYMINGDAKSWIMPPRMMTQSAGLATTAPRGGRTGRQTGRGGGTKVNDGVDGVPDFSNIIAQQLQNLLPTILAQGLYLKEFLACNPKEYDGKGGAIAYTHWVKKMESVQDMSRCGNDQKVKYTAGSFVGKALTWWNSQIHTRSREVAVGMAWEGFKTLMREELCPSNEMQKLKTELWNHDMVGVGHVAYIEKFQELARLVPHLVTPENKRIERYVYGLAPQIRGMVAVTEPTTIQKALQIAGTLIDEAIKNGSIKKNPEKRRNKEEPSKDRNGRDDNKRTKTGNAFATTTNPVRRENTSTAPKCTTCNFYHPPKVPCRTCFNCNRPGHLAKDCRVVPRNVNPVNARNPAAARGVCFKCGDTDHYNSASPRVVGTTGNQARGRAFMLGAEEARQDPNIVTGFSYEIEIASGQLVEIDKVIKGCKLERDGHVFDINLIPFRSGSFDVIIDMD